MAAKNKELTLSPTKVDTFYTCQRKFFYSYVKQPFPAQEHSYFVIGNIAHKCLEVFHSRYFHAGKWAKGMAEAFREALQREDAFGKCEQGIIARADLFTVKQMLSNYIKFLRTSDTVQIRFLERLVPVRIGSVPVWLKADRVDALSDGKYRVVDYKTSKQPARSADERASVQLPSYGLWLRKELGSQATSLIGSYFYLRHIDSKKGVHTHVITEDWMNEAKDKYENVFGLIQNGCKYIKTENAQNCRWCDYRLPCSSNFGLQ